MPAVFVVDPFPDDVAEADAVAGMVARAAAAHGPRSVAVLSRTNATLRAIAGRLTYTENPDLGPVVPIQFLGQRRERLEGETCRGLLAYLRVALNPADDLAVLRALDCPPRPALREDPKFRAAMQGAASGGALMGAARSPGWANAAEQAALTRFTTQVAQLADAVRSSIWTDEFLRILVDAAEDLAALGLHTRAADARWLGMLLLDFQRGGIGKRAQKTAAGFLWWATHGQGAGEHDAEVDAVTLSTVHLAKGLEWPIVFLPGMTERSFPSAQSIDAAALGKRRALDEELRVFFVATSRAANTLVLTSAALVHPAFGGLPFQAMPSRFLRFASP